MADKPDMQQYKLKLKATPRQGDVDKRSVRLYIDKQLSRSEEVPTAECEWPFEVPQDLECQLVIVHADDAKPEPNLAMSEPYIFIARDLTPPAKPEFWGTVEYVGEVDGEDAETTEAPSQPTDAPAESTDAPSEPTDAPSETTAAPAESTDAPSESTDAPVETSAPTDAPAESTDAPSESTDAPAESTDAPSESTDAPSESTDAPAESTDAPSESTEAPVESFPDVQADPVDPSAVEDAPNPSSEEQSQ